MVTGDILQGLILRPVLCTIFIDSLSDGVGCIFIKILDDTKLGEGVALESASRGWELGCQSEGLQQPDRNLKKFKKGKCKVLHLGCKNSNSTGGEGDWPGQSGKNIWES